MEATYSSSTSHVRSISLPSRLNSTSTKIEVELNKLKQIREQYSSSRSQSIQCGLVGLAHLYVSMEELIHFPEMQRALLQHQNNTTVLVEEALEGSIGLLDTCGSLRDLLMSMKEHMQELMFALKRKGGEDSGAIESKITAYFQSQKRTRKNVSKCIATLKRMENKMGSGLVLDADNYHQVTVIRVFCEVACMAISVLRSLSLYLSEKANLTNGFSLISKLATRTRDQTILGEVEMVDLALHFLRKNVRNGERSTTDIQVAMRRLQTIHASVESFEAGLDCLFRRLIQHRASLLDVLAC